MRIAPAMLALVASVLVLPVAAVQPAFVQSVTAARESCTNWTSRSEPPPTVNVYRVNEGFVETVDFKHYVMNVVAREWNVKQKALRRAGAVAAGQYTWFHILHYRGGRYDGRCFDVRDTTADQLFANKPADEIPDQVKTAVNSTWGWHLLRGDKFPMTGYRRGEDVPCAADAGYRLYVRSARKCAKQGWSTQRILEKYYTATLEK